MEIYYEENLPFPKPFKDMKVLISSEKVILRKKHIPANLITGYAYGDLQIKMGPVKGGLLFNLRIFYGKNKPYSIEINRAQFPNHEDIMNGIIGGLWQLCGQPKIKLIIQGVKTGHEVSLNQKNQIKLTPTGISCKGQSIFSSKFKHFEWEFLKTKISNGTLSIGDTRKKSFGYFYPIRETENSNVLIEFLKWKAQHFATASDLSQV